MEKFILVPNLPENNVELGIVDGRITKEIENNFYNRQIKIIKTLGVKELYEAVAYHPDIQVNHLGNNRLLVARNVKDSFVYELEKEGFEIIPTRQPLAGKYPLDISLNAARVGKYLICSIKYTDEQLLLEMERLGIALINVKQGYAKCSICIVNNNAVITSDSSIFNACGISGIECLKISQGNITLKGLNYGFIGGASGSLSNNEVGFYGNIELHPEFSTIGAFIKENNKIAVSLGENLVCDYGTFIPLKEYSILTK